MLENRNGSLIKRIRAVLMAALLILMVPFTGAGYCFAAALTPVGDADAKPPEVRAQSALLYSVDLDEIIYAKNIDKKCDPYSITKLVTAYIAANRLDPDQVVTVSKKAADDLVGGSTMDLLEGEKVTVEQLLYGTLLLSGNDAAYQLAETCSGSIKDFVAEMNRTVKEWGCRDTHFTNPMGLQNKDHYTTARDLLTISKTVLADEKVSSIAFSKKYKMPATNKSDARKMRSHTTLKNKKGSGVLGGKTGYWEKTDCSVALEYSKDQLTAILVLLKDTEKGRVKDAKNLLKFAHEVTPGYLVDDAGADTGKIWVKYGAKTHICTVLADAMHAYPKGQKKSHVDTRIVFDKGVKAPLKKGAKVGTYYVSVDGREVGSSDVVIAETVKKGWFTSAIYISNNAAIGIGIGLVVLIIFVAVIIAKKKNPSDDYVAKH